MMVMLANNKVKVLGLNIDHTIERKKIFVNKEKNYEIIKRS